MLRRTFLRAAAFLGLGAVLGRDSLTMALPLTTFTLSPTSGVAGDTITATGTGFARRKRVQITMAGYSSLGANPPGVTFSGCSFG